MKYVYGTFAITTKHHRGHLFKGPSINIQDFVWFIINSILLSKINKNNYKYFKISNNIELLKNIYKFVKNNNKQD